MVKQGKCQMSSEIVHVERKVPGARKQVRNGDNQQRVFDIVSFTQMGCMFTIKNKKACALHEYETVLNFGTNVTLKPSKQNVVKHVTNKHKKRNTSNSSSSSLSNNNSTCKLNTPQFQDETVSPISTQVSSPSNSHCFNTTCNNSTSSTFSNSSSSESSNKIIRTHLPSIHELLNL